MQVTWASSINISNNEESPNLEISMREHYRSHEEVTYIRAFLTSVMSFSRELKERYFH